MKLWHDDVRPAPEEWTRARTNEEAKALLLTGEVIEGSFDHDLGADENDGIMARGDSPDGSGLDLVRWMIENDLVPERINIHSWSPPGAEAMQKALLDAGYSPSRVPFDVSWLLRS